MNTALYYPHTSIESESLLKTALLLWDKLEYIVPGTWFRQPKPSLLAGAQRDLAEAMEIVGQPIVPSKEEQQLVHTEVERLISGGLPKKYLFEPKEKNYLIYAEKFGGQTWKLLRDRELVGGTVQFEKQGREVSDYSLNPELGLMMMTLLAKVCAGSTALKVTDAKYASNAQGAYFTRLEGGELGQSKKEHETLVVETFGPRLPTQGATLRQLISIRKNEDAFLKELRTKYRDEVDKFILRVSGLVQGTRDYERVWAEFHGKMKAELEELDRLLGRERFSFGAGLFEKIVPGLSVATVTYLSTQSAWAAVSSGVASLGLAGGLKVLGSIPATNDKREGLLRGKAAGWLYAVQNPKATKGKTK